MKNKIILKLLETEEFKNHLESKIKITKPILASKIINIYEVRKQNVLEKGDKELSKKMDDLITEIKMNSNINDDNVIGVSLDLDKPFVFYLSEDFSKLFGVLVSDNI